jgi:hypothetical protein
MNVHFSVLPFHLHLQGVDLELIEVGEAKKEPLAGEANKSGIPPSIWGGLEFLEKGRNHCSELHPSLGGCIRLFQWKGLEAFGSHVASVYMSMCL